MPEAPNYHPVSSAGQSTASPASTPPPVRAPPSTDYDNLDAGHQGHSPTHPMTSTVFNNSPAQYNSYGDVRVRTDHVAWPSDGSSMYLAPLMPATTPGNLLTTTDNHGITDIQHFPAHFIPQSYIGSLGNMPDAFAGVGSLNLDTGSGSIAWMQEGIAEPRLIGLQCRWTGCTTTQPFGRPADLIRHVQTKHIRPLSYQCPECGHRSNRRDNLFDHRLRAHYRPENLTRRRS
ncbi:hypothetical protein BO83DRAFT_50824 [Aspergillus eucalypticola CBS 122712]|uniref:C2H2-type domain-containing protein n=1 Tax=Aspergillus eucalypticola (strain CBS 122712 / IBT 29274) TaxID=1448314 RepID=A0A317VAA9_ASPEC|nr:uncharacterized protein BO83DRAFT_50824 [Aspergillus eucalypticola CBS 122712]PWY71274.1 hypothetical protein BO83DRAFT_50824 [Aspergillus eucalypticola CBS 122712]